MLYTYQEVERGLQSDQRWSFESALLDPHFGKMFGGGGSSWGQNNQQQNTGGGLFGGGGGGFGQQNQNNTSESKGETES